MSSVVFCHHQYPGGISVDTVHNAGAFFPIDAGKFTAAVIHQSIDQCACIMPWCRMDNHSLGFIYHNHVRIFIKDIQRNILRQNFNFFCFRHFHINHVFFTQFIIGFHAAAIELDMSAFHQFLYSTARKVFHILSQKHIQSGANVFFFCRKCKIFHYFSSFFFSNLGSSLMTNKMSAAKTMTPTTT